MFASSFRLPFLALVIASIAPVAHGVSEEEKAFEEKLAAVVPSDAQYRWQTNHEVYAFIHFGINTFTDREWGTGKENPRQFAPEKVDARQWARTLKSAGMSMVMVTVKHHDGFCLWPSRYTEHSVKNSPWKNGQGDVLRELVDACRAENLAVGIYLSPADLFQIENEAGLYGDESTYVETAIPTDPATFKTDPAKGRPAPMGAPTFQFKTDSYNRYFLNQLYELLTEYGTIDEIWFDGAHPKRKGNQQYTYAEWYKLIRTLQPNIVIAIKGPDVRWVGNERGIARESEWSPVGLPLPPEAYNWPDMTGRVLGNRDNLRNSKSFHWYPAEADVSIRPGWFYHAKEDSRVKSPETLLDLYIKSVGRNASFLLNVPPNKQGMLHENDVASLKEFGQRLRDIYGKNLAAGATITASSTLDGTSAKAVVDRKYETYWEAAPWTTPVTLEITLPKTVTFNRILLQEQIKRGQRVEKFSVEAMINGNWRKLTEATTIGYKRILPIGDVSAKQLRIRFDEARVAPTLAEFGLHYDPYQAPTPIISRSPNGAVSFGSVSSQWTLRYTLDGTKPNPGSPEYKSSISLPEGGTVTVTAFGKKDNKAGPTTTQELGYAKNTLKITTGLEKGGAAALDEKSDTFASGGDSFTIDLGSSKRIAGFTYLPRQDGNPSGIIDTYEVYASDNSKVGNADKPTKAGRFDNIENNPIEQVVRFDQPVQARYLHFKANKILGNREGITVAEIGVLAK
ncbi:MAG: alpha-L-fucosidase [Puniceicoccales bacterium]|jgi:alpha-L-fucosidase|nr:alpha-L-fucosidase [Puniceicoccales bacterium]